MMHLRSECRLASDLGILVGSKAGTANCCMCMWPNLHRSVIIAVPYRMRCGHLSACSDHASNPTVRVLYLI